MTTHARYGTPEYVVWQSMKGRCKNPNNRAFHYYGGRGIKVCASWDASFSAFFADMGERPAGYSIDRIDVNGDYCPENCRWADSKTQSRNKRTTSRLPDSTATRDLEERLGLRRDSMSRRLRRGMPLERVVSGSLIPGVAAQRPLKARSDSSTGLRGIQRSGNRWAAYIGMLGQKRIRIGTFDTPEEASAAYLAARAEADALIKHMFFDCRRAA